MSKSVPSREKVLAVMAVIAAMALAMSIAGPGAGADTTATPDPVATATGGTSTNVASAGTLQGVAPNSTVHFHVTTSSLVYTVSARLCKPDANITSTSKFDPTAFGLCIDAPFGASDNDFTTVDTNPPYTAADLDFVVGAGSRMVTSSDGPATTITCGGDNSCSLWLDLSVPAADTTGSTGHVFKHFLVNYAGSSGSSTTASPATTSAPATTSGPSTTAGATTTTSQATTTTSASTTTTSSVTSTTAGTGGDTTTTVAGSGDTTVTPSTVLPGGSIQVNSVNWQANGQVDVVIHSDPIDLGNLTADVSGAVSGSFTVPASLAPGSHTLDLTGMGTNGSARTVSTTLTVADPSTSTTTAGSSGTSGSGSDPISGSALARTGLQMFGLVSVAFFLVVGGSMLTRSSQRRRSGRF